MRRRRSARRVAGSALSVLALGAGALATVGVVTAPTATADAHDWGRCLTGSADRQAVFARAAAVSGVPESVLLGVSYLESRWDDHDGQMSTSGGYGPMHLTLRQLGTPSADGVEAKGEGRSAAGDTQAGTLLAAADATGLTVARLRTDPVANVCGGAAVLASYQPSTQSNSPTAWSKAVARYSDSGEQTAAMTFARQVFAVIRSGEERTTIDGQHVVLAPTPDASVDAAAVRSLGLSSPDDGVIDCPADLGCESVPAPYEKYGSSPGDYGNHDLADRPHDLKIDYIVIHDTEGYWAHDLELVQDPTYLAWNYTIRSSDGHVAEHLNNKNVGWHAGNWYVNMHSIGVEHEGFAASGATWYTERVYESSASLVRYLSAEYGVPLDRAHIIGHDQVPGVDAAHVKGMHWDPGPYWDWEHYMTLLGAPLLPDRRGRSDVVTVVPGFDANPEPVTGCTSAGTACPTQGTNFVYLRTAPSDDAPLVKDPGLHTDGSASTTAVADVGARAAAGQKFVVAKRQGEWIAVWYLGDLAWIHNRNAAGDAVVRPSQGEVVAPSGSAAVPVYGRAYPEASAYAGTAIPAQPVSPLQYTIKPGQSYVLADDDLQTDYYYAKTFNCAYVADDCTDVVGKDRYYEIWLGHRLAYVRAADVTLSQD
ncbi:MAG: N-acetylmuramoyl-L-alanine amidase [Nocardioides sp.]